MISRCNASKISMGKTMYIDLQIALQMFQVIDNNRANKNDQYYERFSQCKVDRLIRGNLEAHMPRGNEKVK